MSSRWANWRPIHTASYFGGRERVSRLWAVMVFPVSSQTSNARRMRFSSEGCSRSAASGSAWRSSSRRGAMPSRSSRAWRACRISPPALPAAKPWPRTTASSHSPVPPTRMGSLPRARMPSTMGMAVWAYRAADHCSPASATATMWWGTPSISASVGAAVPMVSPL